MSDYLTDYSNSYVNELLNKANYKPSQTKDLYGDTKFTDKQTNDLTSQDFLNLMMEQLKNQDFMNPMDDTQFLSQLAQFSSMQYMQELANYWWGRPSPPPSLPMQAGWIPPPAW